MLSSSPFPFISNGVFWELSSSADPGADALVAEASRLSNHPLYHVIRSRNEVRKFMEFHAWCVWDFMSLAKSVQLVVGSFSFPWFPPADPESALAVDEIIRGEEADLGPDGKRQSHFEIYLDAMRQASADTRCIESALQLMKAGSSVSAAMTTANAPPAAVDFVSTTMTLCAGPPHVRIAALSLGREELVPTMLSTLLKNLPGDDPTLSTFLWYIRRHIELDTEYHGPLCARLLRAAVGDRVSARREAIEAGLIAIRARALFLDEILKSIKA